MLTGIGDKIRGLMTQQQSAVNQPQSNMVQEPGGLASSAMPTVAPTLTSGIQNNIPDTKVFGDRTNGMGMLGEGLAASRFNRNNPNQYGIMGGVNLI